MKTGFKKLDKMLGGGINEGEVTIIAGRPAKYKKTLAFNIACSFAKDFYRTMIFSTNLSKTLVQERINKICGNSDINNTEKVNIESYIGINDCSYLTPSNSSPLNSLIISYSLSPKTFSARSLAKMYTSSPTLASQ